MTQLKLYASDPTPLVGESDRMKTLGGDGILTEKDLRDLGAACIRVYLFMRDGAWRTADSIRLVAGKNGQPASEGLRRMRELRKFFTIERRRVHDTRMYEYRLVKRDGEDAS